MSPLADFRFDQHTRDERISESTSISGPGSGLVRTIGDGTAK